MDKLIDLFLKQREIRRVKIGEFFNNIYSRLFDIDECLNTNLSIFIKNDDILSEMVLGVENKLK